MSDLSSLPVELIEMVSASLSNTDILSLRSQSRTLRNGTNIEFSNRFFQDPFEVTGSSTAIRALTAILCNPDTSSAAKGFSQALVVTHPTEIDLTPGTQNVVPTAKEIDGLLAALPRLQMLTIETDNDLLVMGYEDLTPALLEGLFRKACPVSQLTTIDLFGGYIDGALLSKTLSAYEHSLKEVVLRKCNLRDGKTAVKWLEIFRVLCQLDLDVLVLYQLLDPGASEYVVLYEPLWPSPSDESEDPTEGEDRADEEVIITGSAQYTRYYACLSESFVKLGLRSLLRGELYCGM
jgi:hypothetical protein